VSTHRNHLLKTVFSCHPKTGKICVPIFDVENSDKFDPDSVPNLVELSEEINVSLESRIKNEEDESLPNKKQKIENYKRTSLKPYIEQFEQIFLKGLYKDIKEKFKKIAVQKQEKAAIVGDW